MSVENLNERRERLRRQLTDRGYSDQYADSVLFENVSAQVQVLRRQRGMTQEQLAERIGSKQPRISNVESPKGIGEWPNWEVDTLNRVAHALGTRLEITFKSYGSLVHQVGRVTSESLRIPDYADDPVIFPLPAAPEPDPNAPERTRWMQELMIPWLWADELDLQRLYDWLRGSGLPPVGHDEEPYQWLLRGITIQGPKRNHLEKRFAERLSILLGEEPDVVMRDGGEDFLRNLYWTCAGLRRPSFLAEQLWSTYKRLRETKLRGDVRDALQAALVQNQFGETKPLKEIWEPMVERGRHRWLRGGEIVGYEGILARHATIKKDIDKVLWALNRISQRWDANREIEFKRLLWKVPDLGDLNVYRRLLESSKSWASWARALVPVFVDNTGQKSEGQLPDANLPGLSEPEHSSMTASVTISNVIFCAEWRAGGSLRTWMKWRALATTDTTAAIAVEEWGFSGAPKRVPLLNALATKIATVAKEDSTAIGAEALFVHPVILAKTREARA